MITDRLAQVILTELKLEDFKLNDDMLANQVPGWDSLNHIRILAAIEKEFGIRLKSLEVIRLKKIGDLQELINRKLVQF